MIITWAMGLTQHKKAVATIKEIINLLLLRGNIGKPGAGASPIRGHSNVQGDRTMGIWEQMPPAFLDALATGVRLRPAAASTACDAVQTHPGHARRDASRCSSPWAATWSPPSRTPPVAEAAMQKTEADACRCPPS